MKKIFFILSEILLVLLLPYSSVDGNDKCTLCLPNACCCFVQLNTDPLEKEVQTLPLAVYTQLQFLLKMTHTTQLQHLQQVIGVQNLESQEQLQPDQRELLQRILEKLLSKITRDL